MTHGLWQGILNELSMCFLQREVIMDDNGNFLDNLIEVIANEKPPCHGCENYYKCADEQLACRAYDVYVELGPLEVARWPTWKVPNSAYYKKHFNDRGF
jgi:hypothetical protein